MPSKLGNLYREFQARCAAKVSERDFNSIVIEEAGGTDARKLDQAYEGLLEAFDDSEEEPDAAGLAHLVAVYRPIAIFGMAMRWAHNAAGGMRANTQWTRAYINKLPDSAFLYIEPGGYKDDQGRTTPKSLRHWPYKNHLGEVDVPHVRDALSRIPQTDVSRAAQERATDKAHKLLERYR